MNSQTRRRLEWIGSAVVLAIAAWIWLRYFNRNTNLLDEGSTAAQAMRVLRGDLIYRDFFTVVTPFSYYTVAWLLQLFGEQLIVLRWAALVTGLGVAAASLIVARRLCSWPFAAASALLVTVWGWFLVTPNYYSLEAALFGLIALGCYVYGAPSRSWMIAAGVATGVTAMTKQNVGAYVAAGLFVTIWASRLFDTTWDLRGRAKMSAQFIAGISIVVIPTLIWLIASGAGPYLYESWVYYPLAKYPERFSLPFPSFFPLDERDAFDVWVKLVIYMPMVVFPLALIAMAILAWRFQRRGDLDAQREGHALLATWCVGILVLLQAFPRADIPHILFGLQPTLILFAYLCAWLMGHRRHGERTENTEEHGEGTEHTEKSSAVRQAVGAVALIIALLPSAILVRKGYQRIDWEFQNYIVALRTERARGIFTGGMEAQRIDTVTRYVTEHTAPDDYVFVVPWASGFNFLTNRMNPTRTDFMLFEDPEAYPCLLSRLDERPPKYVIYGYTWDVDEKHFSDYAAPVDRYIRSRYEIEFSMDGYEVWRRIETPTPAASFPGACQPRKFRLSDLIQRGR